MKSLPTTNEMQGCYEKAYEKASLKKAAEDARNFYENGVSIEIIAKSMHMTEEQVREIVNEPVTVQD